ncbi:MAG TPA: hypothetical protein VFP10_05145, partial [Candidatus Eisenbacteria bacterium]|nr:hypothetical protein [Candidatus Eisenbacteria bacterium]
VSIVFGILSCASKEPEQPPIELRKVPIISSADTTDERLEPLSCATVRATLPEHLSRMLDLRLSPAMREGWSDAEVVAFARLLTDPEAGDRYGILTRVWDYYGPKRPSGGPRFSFESHGRAYSRIRVDLYFQDDCCRNRCGGEGCPAAWPDSCRDGGWVECGGFGVFRGGNWMMVSGGNCPDPVPVSPEVAAGPVVAHEMAHLSHLARDPYADVAFSELLAVGAEYVTGERWQKPSSNPRSTEYDMSLKSGSEDNVRCAGREVLCKYQQFRLWNGYLFSHFSGDGVDSLDLVYRWIHRDRPSWRGLALTLLEEPFASRLPGKTAGEKLGNLYHRFAMARYMDTSGVYGFGPDVSPKPMHFFEWPDTLALPRRRVMPAVVRLGKDERHSYTSWRDPVQPWGGEEPCRVLTTGSDYWVLLAEDGPERPLRIHVRGAVPANSSFRLGYATYAERDSVLCRKSPLSVVENVIEGASVTADTLDTEFAVSDFGGDVRSVLVVLSMVESEPSESFWGVSACDYEIAVSTGPKR